jgi:hypothetical protein
LTITPPTSPPSAGLPASFSFVVTNVVNGAVTRNVAVTWGDSSAVQNLGPISGTNPVSHVYASAGTYFLTATLTDSAGNSIPVSTSAVVIPVPRPTIIVQATPGQTGTHSATVTIQITTAVGIGIVKTSINYGDNTSEDLGGASSATKTHSYPLGAAQYTITVTVDDTAGNTTTGTAIVSVS